MKYIYSSLILVGGLSVLVGTASLIGYIFAKLYNFEAEIDNGNIKYRKFKTVMQEKVLPLIFSVIIIVLFLVLLAGSYFEILENF